MDEIRVETWAELQEQLFADAWQEELERHRSNFAFRGRARADEDLRPSLVRLGGDARSLEVYLLRNFRKYARRGDVAFDSVWDWTYSPYVALHFATASPDAYDVDGVVWALDYVAVHERLPDALSDVLEQEGANVFTPELLARAAPGFRELEALAVRPFCLFLEPPSLDDRIVNQYALFSLLSTPTATLDEWLGGYDAPARKIVIPAELKWEVRDKLDQANITERVLFPGLDGLSAWLTRYYLPRTGR